MKHECYKLQAINISRFSQKNEPAPWDRYNTHLSLLVSNLHKKFHIGLSFKWLNVLILFVLWNHRKSGFLKDIQLCQVFISIRRTNCWMLYLFYVFVTIQFNKSSINKLYQRIDDLYVKAAETTMVSLGLFKYRDGKSMGIAFHKALTWADSNWGITFIVLII